MPAPGAMEFLDIHHVQLAMPAGAEAVAEGFYADLLGLSRLDKPEALRGRGGCWFGSSHLQVHLGVDPNFAPARKAHPAFLVSALEPLERRLETAGVPIVRDTQLLGYRRFYVADPFGNRLEFIERAS